MNEKNLTTAYIKQIKERPEVSIKIPLEDIKNSDYFPFLLVIQSKFENSMKLTIYPINKEKIIKLIFSGLNIPNEIFEELTKILQNFQIIHTSGFLLREGKLLYECYLNLNFSENKSEDLKTALDKIKNIFKEIKLQEISLKTTNKT
jgi:hypothetical protein